MIVAGRVSQKMAPVLRQIYDQMAEPKWVLAMGVCASSGGMFNNYAIVQGVDHVVPVDMYLPGCPPRPEMLIDAILKLHDKIQAHQARRQPARRDRGATRQAALNALPTTPDEGPAAMSRQGRQGARATSRRSPRAPTADAIGKAAENRSPDRSASSSARGRRRPARHVRRPAAPATPPGTAAWSAPSRCPGATARAVRRLVRRGRRPRSTEAARPPALETPSRRSSCTAARSPSTSAASTCSRSRSCCATTPRCASSSARGVSGVHYPDDTGPRAARRLPPALDDPQPADPARGHLPRRRPAHPVASSRSTRPTTGTSARPTTSSASSSTATPR